MIKPIFFTEGLQMFRRKIRVRKTGFKKYSGDAKAICREIVKDCYNHEKNYFMASKGHFCEYWSRDFGLCVKPLKELGYEKEIRNTLNYALKIFKEKRNITTTISPKKTPFDFPRFAPDSLAFTLHSLITLDKKNIVNQYKEFLESEARKYLEKVIEKNTGLVKKKYFSSMKDHSIRESSCYDNVMSAWISKNLEKLKLKNPLKDYNLKKIIKNNFWTGTYFIDDLSGREMITSDANVFPFWTEIFDSKKMMKSAVETLIEKKLDKPFPIKYSKEKPKVVWYDSFAKGYQAQTIWPMIGYPYIEVVSKVNKNLAKNYLKQYSKIIEKYKTFLEVYFSTGKPYKLAFYYADEGMLWASMHLYLSEKL
ncbi:MAG: hypothetical protein ISS25_00485 [Nanoarchaeota archaeon]|nr:hypothetical protein [DPANN group archaeon]MBL7116293.1 hypothetical protein [Nanoarchaeota archaeon]